MTQSERRDWTGDVFGALPARQGHFYLESGYHTDLWLTLDGLFADPAGVAPLVSALGERLRPHNPAAICGPLLGGAFLAQAVATTLGARFYYTEPLGAPRDAGLFTAEYRLPLTTRQHLREQTVAVVDDVISAGSSVRATVAALAAAGASTVVVGALLVLGDAAREHFTEQAIPLETLGRRPFELWKPLDCPLCRAGSPLEDPREPAD